MSINEKVKSIVHGVLEQLLDAVNEEFKSALQEALADIKGSGLPLRQPARVPVPRAVAEGVVKDHKLCRHEGCTGVAVPRYRNFCKDHKELAPVEAKAIKRKKAKRKQRRAAKKG